jgi:hypothetical protein
MKKLKLKQFDDHNFLYENDIDRIVRIFADRGYEITGADAAKAWEKYSDLMAAGWMCLDKEDDYVFDNAMMYFEPVD